MFYFFSNGNREDADKLQERDRRTRHAPVGNQLTLLQVFASKSSQRLHHILCSTSSDPYCSVAEKKKKTSCRERTFHLRKTLIRKLSQLRYLRSHSPENYIAGSFCVCTLNSHPWFDQISTFRTFAPAHTHRSFCFCSFIYHSMFLRTTLHWKLCVVFSSDTQCHNNKKNPVIPVVRSPGEGRPCSIQSRLDNCSSLYTCLS